MTQKQKTTTIRGKRKTGSKYGDYIEDYPQELRGPTNNKYGGHNNRKLRGFKGSKYGPASQGRTLSAEEVAAIAKSMNLEVA